MLLRGGMSHDDVLAEEEGALLGFRRDLAALERVHAAGAAASAAFAAPGAAKDLHPAVTMDAVVAESEAADHAQARPTASTALVDGSICCGSRRRKDIHRQTGSPMLSVTLLVAKCLLQCISLSVSEQVHGSLPSARHAGRLSNTLYSIRPKGFGYMRIC